MSDESFTNQKRRIATKDECGFRWGAAKNGERFRCYLCGHRFVEGDGWRWQYDNNPGGYGNFMVCDNCDGEDVLTRWATAHDEWNAAKRRAWWAQRTENSDDEY